MTPSKVVGEKPKQLEFEFTEAMGFPDMRIWRAVGERCLWDEARS